MNKIIISVLGPDRPGARGSARAEPQVPRDVAPAAGRALQGTGGGGPRRLSALSDRDREQEPPAEESAGGFRFNRCRMQARPAALRHVRRDQAAAGGAISADTRPARISRA